MKAYKRWDVSGTAAFVSVAGEIPPGAQLSIVNHVIADGMSEILDPVELLVRLRDGTAQTVPIQTREQAES